MDHPRVLPFFLDREHSGHRVVRNRNRAERWQKGLEEEALAIEDLMRVAVAIHHRLPNISQLNVIIFLIDANINCKIIFPPKSGRG
jgi:hypothetical protein